MTYTTRKRPCIELRYNRYLAVLDVPKDLRARIGKARFVKSLATDSPTEAERRAQPFLTAWRRQIAEARGQQFVPADDAPFFRRALSKARSEAEREAIRAVIWDEAYEVGSAHADPDQDPTDAPEAADFYARATAVGFADFIAEWLASSSATEKTKHMQSADLRRFAESFPSVNEVSRAAVKRWTDALMAAADPEKRLTAKTVRRILSALRGYWRYLQSVEVAPKTAAPEIAEPFAGLGIGAKGGRAKQADKRQRFKPSDVVRLWIAATKGGDAELADLIDVGRWTGARIGELCSLEISQVHLSGRLPHFIVNEGKTDAALREVPIHPKVMTTFKRLIGKRKTGYVFDGLTANKFGDRSNAIGKRFGRLKTKEGFVHSIRKTVANMLETAGVPESTSADILGHDKPTMTYGLYSGGTSLKTRRAAIEKLRYPARA
jgi:integrase